MPNPLNSVTCGDGYTDAATISDAWTTNGGWYGITTNSVYMQLQYGVLGTPFWTEEQFQGVGSAGTLGDDCTGIRFRNAIAGQNATVSGTIALGDEPPLGPSGLTFGSTYSIVGHGRKSGTAGSATAIQSILPCASIVVRANPTNTGLVYLGDTTVNNSNGLIMSPGDYVAFDVANTHQVCFDVQTTNDGISWMAVG